MAPNHLGQSEDEDDKERSGQTPAQILNRRLSQNQKASPENAGLSDSDSDNDSDTVAAEAPSRSQRRQTLSESSRSRSDQSGSSLNNNNGSEDEDNGEWGGFDANNDQEEDLNDAVGVVEI